MKLGVGLQAFGLPTMEAAQRYLSRLPSLLVELGPAWPSATKHIPQGRLLRAHRGGGQQNQAPSGPGKGQLGRSCAAGRAQSGPHFSPVPPAARSRHSPILILCPNSSLSGYPGTYPPHRPGASLGPNHHQHISRHMLAHTKKHTYHPPWMHTPTHKHMGTSTHTDACTYCLCIAHGDTCPEIQANVPHRHATHLHLDTCTKTHPETNFLHKETCTPHRHITCTHPPKTYTPPPTFRPHTHRLTHTSLV